MIKKVESIKTLVVGAERGTSIDEIKALAEEIEKGTVVQITQIGTGASIEMMVAQRKDFQIKEGPLGVSRILAEGDMYYMVHILTDGTDAYEKEIKKHQRALDLATKLKEADRMLAEANVKAAELASLKEQVRKAEVAAKEAALAAGIKEPVKSYKTA